MSERESTFLEEDVPVVVGDNPLEELVGDGKKYKTVDELAKAYKNADQFIETLKTEKRTVEEQYHDALAKSKSVEEILAALNETKTTIVEVPQTQATVDVRGEVDKVLAERETAAKKKATAAASWSKLADLYGDLDRARVAVTEYVGGDPTKAKLIEALGSTNPTEMVKFMASMKKPIETFTDGGDGSNSDSSGIPAGLTWKLAKDVKKNNPRLFNSMKFQTALHNAAASNTDFYK